MMRRGDTQRGVPRHPSPRHAPARRARSRRTPWILAAALFGAVVLGFGPVASVLTGLTGTLPGTDGGVAGAAGPEAILESPEPAEPADPPSARFDPATLPIPPRPPFVDVPPEPIRPLAPHALRGYVWPLEKGRLTLGFRHTPWGSWLVDGERFHDGIDLATFCGDRIVAAHDGVVVAAGRRYDHEIGRIGDLEPYFARLDRKRLWQTLPIVVIVDDGNGYRSVYAHFSKIKVRVGDEVRAGQLLGFEGMTGHASGCHLHYSIYSPLETARFRLRPDIVKRMKLPGHEVARIDPLRVLPPRAKDPEPNILDLETLRP